MGRAQLCLSSALQPLAGSGQAAVPGRASTGEPKEPDLALWCRVRDRETQGPPCPGPRVWQGLLLPVSPPSCRLQKTLEESWCLSELNLFHSTVLCCARGLLLLSPGQLCTPI